MTVRLPVRLIEALATRRANHFALVSTAGSVPEAPAAALGGLLAADPRFSADAVFELEARNDGLSLVRARRERTDIAFDGPIGRHVDLRTVFTPAHGPMIAIVDRIGDLPIEQQLEWLGKFRSFRESRQEPFRLVATGDWPTTAFMAHWQQVRPDSPSLDASNVFQLAGYDQAAVESRLSPFLLTDSTLARRALVELAWEHTRGDRRLIARLIDALGSFESRPRDVDVEHAIFQLAEQSVVIEEILVSVDKVSERARQKLGACLRTGAIVLDSSDVDAEALLLAGLLRRVPRAGRPRWHVASPVVSSVLRRYQHRLHLSEKQTGSDVEILPTCNPVAAHASRLVGEIETILRNIVVIALNAVDDVEHPLAAVPRGADEDVYARACSRRDEDRGSAHVQFVRQPLSAHLEVADLLGIIGHKDLYDPHFKRFFADRTQFQAQFEAFNHVRRAAAHNKLASVSILPRLEASLDYFEGELARAAARIAAHEPVEALVRIDAAGARVLTSPKECIIEVELENVCGAGLYGVAAMATYSSDSDASFRGEARVKDLALAKGEKRKAQLRGKLPKVGNVKVVDVCATAATRSK